MRKFFLLILSLALIVCLALSLVACRNETDGIVKLSVNQSTLEEYSGEQSAVESERESNQISQETSSQQVDETSADEEQPESVSSWGGLVDGGTFSAH